MTHEANRPSVGSVAEEAARLIGLLSADLTEAEARAAGARASARTGVCETCGHDASGQEGAGPQAQYDPVCRLCPVCQLIAFVKGISPETIERLADVVDMLGVGLRVLAESRRDAAARPQPAGPQEQPDQPQQP